MTFTPLPAWTTMPAPLDSGAADGVDAYAKSIAAGNTNFGYLPPWSAPYVTEAYTGTEYANVVTPAAGWTITSFNATLMNKLVAINMTASYNASITFLGDGSLTGTSISICTGLPPELRGVLTGWSISMDARIANTAVFVIVNYPAAGTIALYAGAIPSRVIPANSVLTMHAMFFNQVAESTWSP